MEQNDDCNIVSFTPFSLFIASTYWYKLADKKLLKDKSEEHLHRIWGYCSMYKNVPKLVVDYTSFNREYSLYLGKPVKGYQLNRNTKDLFDNECNYENVIKQITDDLFRSIVKETFEPQNLVPFIVYTFSDLKTFQFYYRFSYVTYEGDYFYRLGEVVSINHVFTDKQKCAIADVNKSLSIAQQLMYFIRIDDSVITPITVDDFISNDKYYAEADNTYLCFFDPVHRVDDTSLIVRNGLFFLFLRCEYLFNKSLKIILLKNADDDSNLNNSVLYAIKRLNGPLPEKPLFIDVKVNEDANRAKFVDLRNTMDPLKLSERLTYLNLKLMTWNVEPNFDLERIVPNSCLLLGAGTLGCSVARLLIGWGFQKLTFVDNGVVSYGNPVRQSLYVFDDCVNRKKKVKAATDAVKKINPRIDVEGVDFTIPSLGRGPINMNDFDKLEELIKSRDIIFLLTDSRESRWLPTLICSRYSKLAITTALGFDSYLVMRHGINADDGEEKLGCYFCTDVVAPNDSSYGRLLDQQCTVTRTGVADIASSLAVELVVSLIHHPERGRAKSNSESCFGKIPHTIRGNLRDFSQIFPSFKSYDKCVACSTAVLTEFQKNKSEFLERVFVNPKSLEDITGITEMKSNTVDDLMQALSDTE